MKWISNFKDISCRVYCHAVAPVNVVTGRVRSMSGFSEDSKGAISVHQWLQQWGLATCTESQWQQLEAHRGFIEALTEGGCWQTSWNRNGNNAWHLRVPQLSMYTPISPAHGVLDWISVQCTWQMMCISWWWWCGYLRLLTQTQLMNTSHQLDPRRCSSSFNRHRSQGLMRWPVRMYRSQWHGAPKVINILLVNILTNSSIFVSINIYICPCLKPTSDMVKRFV